MAKETVIQTTNQLNSMIYLSVVIRDNKLFVFAYLIYSHTIQRSTTNLLIGCRTIEKVLSSRLAFVFYRAAALPPRIDKTVICKYVMRCQEICHFSIALTVWCISLCSQVQQVHSTDWANSNCHWTPILILKSGVESSTMTSDMGSRAGKICISYDRWVCYLINYLFRINV